MIKPPCADGDFYYQIIHPAPVKHMKIKATTYKQKMPPNSNGFEGKSMVLLFRRAKSHPPKTPFFLFGGLKAILYFHF